jgi:hypothetical protein
MKQRGALALILKQRVPPESYYFKESHFDGICLMVVDLFSETWVPALVPLR